MAQTPPTLCRWLSALWLPRAWEPVAIRHDTTDTRSVGFVPMPRVRGIAVGASLGLSDRLVSMLRRRAWPEASADGYGAPSAVGV